jgi:hypothetical protein
MCKTNECGTQIAKWLPPEPRDFFCCNYDGDLDLSADVYTAADCARYFHLKRFPVQKFSDYIKLDDTRFILPIGRKFKDHDVRYDFSQVLTSDLDWRNFTRSRVLDETNPDNIPQPYLRTIWKDQNLLVLNPLGWIVHTLAKYGDWIMWDPNGEVSTEYHWLRQVKNNTFALEFQVNLKDFGYTLKRPGEYCGQITSNVEILVKCFKSSNCDEFYGQLTLVNGHVVVEQAQGVNDEGFTLASYYGQKPARKYSTNPLLPLANDETMDWITSRNDFWFAGPNVHGETMNRLRYAMEWSIRQYMFFPFWFSCFTFPKRNTGKFTDRS